MLFATCGSRASHALGRNAVLRLGPKGSWECAARDRVQLHAYRVGTMTQRFCDASQNRHLAQHLRISARFSRGQRTKPDRCVIWSYFEDHSMRASRRKRNTPAIESLPRLELARPSRLTVQLVYSYSTHRNTLNFDRGEVELCALLIPVGRATDSGRIRKASTPA